MPVYISKYPKYVKHVVYSDREAYVVQGHPTLKSKRFSSKECTLDQLYAQCIAYLNSHN